MGFFFFFFKQISHNSADRPNTSAGSTAEPGAGNPRFESSEESLCPWS